MQARQPGAATVSQLRTDTAASSARSGVAPERGGDGERRFGKSTRIVFAGFVLALCRDEGDAVALVFEHAED
jgi:hypothetical protein